MKTIVLAVLLVGFATVLPAQPADEAQQIQILQSVAGPAAKADACRRLKQIGTATSVPALARWLTDEKLSQAACDALETQPVATAGAALHAALAEAAGNPRIGIIHALGERRHRPATAELARLLSDADVPVAMAAARALGRIGEEEALQPLQQFLKTAAEPLRSAIVDALLDGAAQWTVAGRRGEARLIYERLGAAKEKEHVRIAAYAGLIRASEDQALALVVAGLAGPDAAQSAAALRLAREIQDPKATAAFTNLLAQSKPLLQIALLRLLQQRGDAGAAPAVFAAAQNPEATVRIPALAALGTLGDANAVSLLANAATSKDEAEQKTARQALIELRRGDVGNTMIARLAAERSEVQVELIRALTARRDTASASRLLEIAQAGNPAARRMALRGLEQLADDSHLTALIELLKQAKDEATRAEVQSVFETLADRTPAGQKLKLAPLVEALNAAEGPTRIALLQVSSCFADAGLRDALRAALTAADAAVRAAAARALCRSRDPELLPDLLDLARTTKEANLHALALEGFVRLVGDGDATFPATRRAPLLQSAYALAISPEEKRLLFSALGAAPSLETLQLADRAWQEVEIKSEAEIAIARIASALLAGAPLAASTSLQRLAEHGSSLSVQTNAQAILKQFDSGWLYSGPYRQADVEGLALFDVAFAPEQSGANPVVWRRAAGTAELARAGEVDLQNVVAGDHCVVYLKTSVFVPTTQTVRFEIGSDDGIKLWMNGELVHAHNVLRALTPGQDRVEGKLRAGWNDLRAKVTQATAGCGMMLNLKRADGSAIAGLRFDPRGDLRATGFRRVQLSDQFYAEGAYYGDFNRDGKLDVVAGPFWYAGPDFQQRHEIRPPVAFDPKNYSDNFLTYVADFNGDGWPDVFAVPFPGTEGYWYENPQDSSGPWPRHLACPMVGNESPVWVDVDGDGRPDLVFNNEGFLGYATYDPARATEPWQFHAVSPRDSRFQRFTHGIGAGDINGDGRVDLVEATGWWEQPADLTASAPWKFHPYKFAEAAAQMLVTDVDGDGLADVITSWHCHHYGLVWYRQQCAASGEITWEQNVILPPAPDLKLDALRFSQLHSLELVDMNGDGLKDIVTGKRFWAHGPTGDVEPDAPAVLYWFELRRAQGKAAFVPHLIDDDSGIGTQVTAIDLNGDHRPDVIVANKKGIFLHLSDADHQQ